MRCERVEALLSDYCEDAIQAALRIPLEHHLGECESCRRQVETLRNTWKLLDSAPSLQSPGGLRAAVWQRIDAQEQAGTGRSWIQRLLPDFSRMGRQRKIAWAAGVGLVILMAGVVVPGRYTPAGLSRLGAGLDSQFVAARPLPGEFQGQSVLKVPLYLMDEQGKVSSSSVIPVRLRVLSGPVKLAGSASLTVNHGTPAEFYLLRESNDSSEPAVIEVRRADAGEPATQILTIPLPSP